MTIPGDADKMPDMDTVQLKPYRAKTDPFVTLAKRLKDLRQSKGWTPQQMSANAGLSYQGYLNLEDGKPPNLKTLKRICQSLGIRLGELFDGI